MHQHFLHQLQLLASRNSRKEVDSNQAKTKVKKTKAQHLMLQFLLQRKIVIQKPFFEKVSGKWKMIVSTSRYEEKGGFTSILT